MTEALPHAMSEGGHQSIVVETYSGRMLVKECVFSEESDISRVTEETMMFGIWLG
jgi:hypothetical protein